LSDEFYQKAHELELISENFDEKRLEFILFHQSRGTESFNWDAEFLRWLLIGKKYTPKEKNNELRKLYTSKNYKSATSVDRVLQAHTELFQDPHGRIIDG
jgi:hypothetical protein